MMSDNVEDRMTEISNEVSLPVKVNTNGNKLKKTSFTKTVSSIIVKVKC